MKIEAGSKAKIYCLSDKPDGEVVSVADKTVVIKIDRGTLVVDKEDIVEGDEFLKVLNYTELNVKASKLSPSDGPEKFADDMMSTVETIGDKNIYKMFMHFIRTADSTKPDGRMFPLPCIFEMPGDEKSPIAMAGLALPVPHVYSAASGIIAKEKPKELIFGTFVENKLSAGKIDPKFGKVFCIFRMKRGKWMYGVIGYNTKEDLKNQEPDWKNEAWTTKMKALLGSGGAIPIPEKVGTAYGNKIDIKLWRENSHGYFYEGDIIFDKLDKNTQRYVTENKLGLDFSNKETRTKIAEFFDSNGMKLDFKFLGGDSMFINLMVTNKGLMFMDRRSRTRAILEAIEALAKEKYENNSSKS